MADQVAVLNTNVRYLHGNLVSHAEALVASMPEPLQARRPPSPPSPYSPMQLWGSRHPS